MSVQQLRHELERRKGQRLQLQKNVKTLNEEIKEKKRDLTRHEQAREIIRLVGMKTMQQLQNHISNISSLALETVFDDPYQLLVEFVQRRNKTECDLFFVRKDKKADPMSASGFGAVDIASFALRIAMWSMGSSRNTIIMDEPFKHLKGIEPNKRVLQLVNEISKQLHVQFIMVSDERIPREDIIELADRVYEVRIEKGISKVNLLK